MGSRAGVASALLLLAAVLAAVPVGAQTASEATGADLGDGLSVERRSIEFGAGWIVPALDDDEGDEGAIGHGHLAASGADAQGAAIGLEEDQQMVVLDTLDSPGTFALRSHTAGEWSAWIELSVAPDEAPDGIDGEGSADPGLPAIGPIWVGGDTDSVELIRLDGDDTPIDVELLSAQPSLLAASVADAAALAEPAAAPLAGLATRPTIQPRSAWADRGWEYSHETCEDGPLEARNIDAMVVHHTVTANTYGAEEVPAIMRGIYRTHVDVNGWCDIAYNFMIDRFGRIWEARTSSLDLPVISGATKGFNTATLSVAVLAQYQEGASPASAAPPQAVLDAVAALGAWKLGLYGVDPQGEVWLKSRTSATSGLRYADGTWVHVPTILGHRDLGLTSCPGSRFYPSLPSIRATIGATRSLDVQFPSREPLDSGPAVLAVDGAGRLRPAGAAATPTAGVSTAGGSVLAIAARNGAGYALLDTGAVRGLGGAGAPTGNPAGSTAVVDIAISSAGGGGWVLDVNGTLHGFGGASDRVPSGGSLHGAALAVAMRDDASGYVLDRNGTLHSFGGAPTLTSTSVAAVDLVLRSNGTSGWILDVDGTLHAFGGAPGWQSALAGSSGNRARAVFADPFDTGGWVLDSEGRLHSFGRPRQVQPISTTAGTPSIVDGTLWWDLPADLAETDDGAYVDAVVELFLGRSPSLAELDSIAWDIDYRSRAEVVDDLARSPEWAGVIIDQIYLDVLGRTPDPQGRAYWLERLASGMRTQELGAEFYASPEYVRASGSTDQWLVRIYDALLHRRPDAQGIAFWRQRLAAGTTPSEVTTGFYNSVESRTDRVVALYQRVLGRAPDQGGLDFWAERLIVAEDDIALARNLAISPEFYDRATGD